METLFLTSENGCLFKWNGGQLETVFSTDDYLMGIAHHKGELFLGGRSRLFRLGGPATEILKPVGDFHHIEVIDSKLYVTVTRLNQIWVFDLQFNLLEKHKIAPPDPRQKVGKPNYNHLNKIIKHHDNFYINLNWLTNKQFGPSGVAIFDEKMREIKRISLGWQTHGFRFIDDKTYVLCASTRKLQRTHPHQAGLMVNGQIVFEHSPDKFFCKDFAVGDCIYIVGGDVQERDERKNADGVIFVLDKQFVELDRYVFSESGGFKGALVH